MEFRWTELAAGLYTTKASRDGATVDVHVLIDPANTILYVAGHRDDPIADGGFIGTVAELQALDNRLLLDAGYVPA